MKNVLFAAALSVSAMLNIAMPKAHADGVEWPGAWIDDNTHMSLRGMPDGTPEVGRLNYAKLACHSHEQHDLIHDAAPNGKMYPPYAECMARRGFRFVFDTLKEIAERDAVARAAPEQARRSAANRMFLQSAAQAFGEMGATLQRQQEQQNEFYSRPDWQRR